MKTDPPREDGTVPEALLLGPFCAPLAHPRDPAPAHLADGLALAGGEARPDHAPRPGGCPALPRWLTAPGPGLRAWRRVAAGPEGFLDGGAWTDWFRGIPRGAYWAFYFTLYRGANVRFAIEGAEAHLVYLDGRPVAWSLPGGPLREGSVRGGAVAAEPGFHAVLVKTAFAGGVQLRVRLLRGDGEALTSAHLRLRPRPGHRGQAPRRGRRRAVATPEPGPVHSVPRITEAGEGWWQAVRPLGRLTASAGHAERRPTRLKMAWTGQALVFRIDAFRPGPAGSERPLLWLEDHVRVALDPDHSHRGVCVVLVAESGRVLAWRKTPGGGFEALPGVTAETEETLDGWTGDVAVPWAALGAAPVAGRVLGFNAVRMSPGSADGVCVWYREEGKAAEQPVPPWIRACEAARLGHVQLIAEDGPLPLVERLELVQAPSGGPVLEAAFRSGPHTQRPVLDVAVEGLGAAEAVRWPLRVPRFGRVAESMPIEGTGPGPGRVRVTMHPAPGREAVPLGEWPVRVPATFELPPAVLHGGWPAEAGGRPGRRARFGLAARENFLGVVPCRGWPASEWLLYAEIEASGAAWRLLWNETELAPLGGEGAVAAVVPREVIHRGDNEVRIEAVRGGRGAAMLVRGLRVVTGEEPAPGRFSVPAWRWLSAARGVSRLIPLNPQVPRVRCVPVLPLRPGDGVSLPMLLTGTAPLLGAGLGLRLTLSGRRGMAAPSIRARLGEAAMEPQPARAERAGGLERLTLGFTAAGDAVGPGARVVRIETGGGGRWLWWLHGVDVTMDAGGPE
jgi:hypothetical protein